jgi:hypothetical protein
VHFGHDDFSRANGPSSEPRGVSVISSKTIHHRGTERVNGGGRGRPPHTGCLSALGWAAAASCHVLLIESLAD